MTHPHAIRHGNSDDQQALRVLAWETTRACPLACPHCRAAAVDQRDPDELTTAEAVQMLASAAEIGPALIILSGGEPLLRPDLEEIASRAVELGHRPVVSCNDGRLLNDSRLDSLAAAGIRHFSFSMHACNEAGHDGFVRVPGAFREALLAFSRIRAHGMSFQINTTVLPGNSQQLEELKDWVVSLGAAAWHLFFIVPTGRAATGGSEVELSQSEIDRVLRYVAQNSDDWPIPVKVTCAPQYAMIRGEMGREPGSRGRSCMAGNGFVFVSWRGDVKPCGYFDLVVGNIRERPLKDIYLGSQQLKDMRTPEKFTGVCGVCRFNKICGGCRARAYAVHGSYMATDPNCKFSAGQRDQT
ncbi:MAG TPA: radical SAM protein [Candidatus Rifleibacterium sp.]|nr:radical SAM protein [Candidatus Rifleibacterium sp.]HPT47589.1 radical SAM protein [Candidatus Rifleibacterium sp.]